MKAIILCAGMGSRLMPYTANTPKALVPFAGRPILEYTLEAFRQCGIGDISLVVGYRAEAFDPYSPTKIPNPEYASTNMVYSLMKAKALFDGQSDLIICYGDIIFEPRVLKQLLSTPGDVVVSADTAWQKLWSLRMEDPVSDAETFRVDPENRVIELGKKIDQIEDVQSQYIGLVKVSRKFAPKWLDIYRQLGDSTGDKFPTMYMTDFIQGLIDHGHTVVASFHERGWLEFDTCSDLRAYEALVHAGRTELLGFRSG